MHTGMLWLDTSHDSLKQKIQKAIDYYQKKYSRTPNLCFVHPSMAEPGANLDEIPGLTIRPYRPVLPGHIWIGLETEPEPVEAG